MSPQIEVDTHACVGSSWCVNVASAVFRLGADGKAEVIDPDAASEDDLLEAADSCPVSAILIHPANNS